MPEQLTRFQRDHRGQEVQSLALDANENYFFRCTDSSGQSWTDVPDIQQYYPELFEWFEINEARQSRATFGSNVGEFFVWADNGAWQYQNLNLPQWLQKDKRRVKQVALGINGAWFILFTNGQWSMACDTTYPDLYKILNAHERGDVVVSKDLDPVMAYEAYILDSSSSLL
ncbi:hypothetical protein QQS21_011516 [Conoideocrella luteorostrata]|uniref:Uncharacterized protein n=1 Tax=Conoideocrella luteorostrata TaxID=1105319 RepID=A0AAJ0CCZ2_9HYPO|nr:hypothetical protein QQS21_011516 [Conoideocrella luteorostrata]